MLIKLNKDRTLSGPGGTIYGGRTAEVPEATGRDLIAGGYAVEVIAAPVEPPIAKSTATVTATAPPAPENATAHDAAPRRQALREKHKAAK